MDALAAKLQKELGGFDAFNELIRKEIDGENRLNVGRVN